MPVELRYTITSGDTRADGSSDPIASSPLYSGSLSLPNDLAGKTVKVRAFAPGRVESLVGSHYFKAQGYLPTFEDLIVHPYLDGPGYAIDIPAGTYRLTYSSGATKFSDTDWRLPYVSIGHQSPRIFTGISPIDYNSRTTLSASELANAGRSIEFAHSGGDFVMWRGGEGAVPVDGTRWMLYPQVSFTLSKIS